MRDTCGPPTAEGGEADGRKADAASELQEEKHRDEGVGLEVYSSRAGEQSSCLGEYIYIYNLGGERNLGIKVGAHSAAFDPSSRW